ncbi:hypothetical protein BV20DRAFT_1055866 [Pilatotrama ljubarskyi]|nr:hypothetical protein BV20DRAFT_1055866 [Pilatotrama ljubarskyi]
MAASSPSSPSVSLFSASLADAGPEKAPAITLADSTASIVDATTALSFDHKFTQSVPDHSAPIFVDFNTSPTDDDAASIKVLDVVVDLLSPSQDSDAREAGETAAEVHFNDGGDAASVPAEMTPSSEGAGSPVAAQPCPPGLEAPQLDLPCTSPDHEGSVPSDDVAPLDAAPGEVVAQAPQAASSAAPASPAPMVHESTAAPVSAVEQDLSAYLLDGVQPPESFIPDSLFPDELLVHDLDGVTRATEGSEDGAPRAPVRYVRIYPKSSRDDPDASDAFAGRVPGAPVHTAHLYLQRTAHLGSGHHSTVYRAPLTLRLDPDSEETSRVSVAVKAAIGECGAHSMLRTEAKVYNAFPRHIMEDRFVTRSEWIGGAQDSDFDDEKSEGEGDEDGSGCNDVNLLPAEDSIDPEHCAQNPEECEQVAASAAAIGETFGDLTGSATAATQPPSAAPEGAVADEQMLLPAIVPKFFGYYSPLQEDGTIHPLVHRRYCSENSVCSVDWPTSVLLLEECGTPVDRNSPKGFRLL